MIRFKSCSESPVVSTDGAIELVSEAELMTFAGQQPGVESVSFGSSYRVSSGAGIEWSRLTYVMGKFSNGHVRVVGICDYTPAP